jgi:hypothetical protein
MMNNLHIAVAAVVTLGVGWLMLQAGIRKSALEWRRHRRICPACGREIRAGACGCSST